MRATGGGELWHHIIPGGDSLVEFAADRNIENPEGVFIVYEVNNAHIRRIMSDDSCETWINAGYVSQNGKSPSIAAGGDGYVYITYQDTSNYKIGILRYTNNWSSPSIHSAIIDSSSDGIYTPTVAA
ncbi:MAG: hypothetical protein GWP03_05255, partial [Proteobacteria bacterium]|nr:hypothetical protein [Pseudomonadota bacterium]